MSWTTTKFIFLAWLLAAPSCAIEPAAPVEPVGPRSASAGAGQLPAERTRGNRALLVSVPAPLGIATDLDRLRKAFQKMPGKYVVSTVNPESASDVAGALSPAAKETATDGTLVAVFTGFANDKGALTLPDGSQFGYNNLLAAVGTPIPPFKTLAIIIAASQGDSWVRQSKALDHTRNFSSTIIATTIPRMSGDHDLGPTGGPGAALDEMKLELLHPAASRLFAVLRQSLEATPATDLESALGAMRKSHDLLYGPGPVVEFRSAN